MSNAESGKLQQLGVNPPCKAWFGPTPSGAWDSASERAVIIGEMRRRLFPDVSPRWAPEDYAALDDTDAVALAALALKDGNLSVLGRVGQGGEFLAPRYRPALGDMAAMRAAVPVFRAAARFLSNVDETGGFFEVGPDGSEEIVIIGYTPEDLAVLYWATSSA